MPKKAPGKWELSRAISQGSDLNIRDWPEIKESIESAQPDPDSPKVVMFRHEWVDLSVILDAELAKLPPQADEED